MKTRYARSGGAKVGYQVAGDGPIDLVFVPGFASHVEMQWADPSYAMFLGRLASFSRLIMFDPRGAGASDRVSDAPTLEGLVQDLRCVMDAARSRAAAILGFSAGGSAATVFAATYPHRCAALILCSTLARGALEPDDTELPGDELREMYDRLLAVIGSWGEGTGLGLFAPSLAGSSFHRRAFGLFERAAIDRERLTAVTEAVQNLDIRHVLTSIEAPTLVLHRTHDFVPVSHSRYLAARIAGARLAELDGSDHLPYAGDASAIVREIETFLQPLTGHEPSRTRRHAVLLFTDVVGSTERVVSGGDARWRDTRETHDELSRAEIERAAGRVVNSTGDGVFAVFDCAASAIRCAWAIREQVHRLGLEVRAGVHAGDCETIGEELAGVAVHAANRVMSAAGPGEVLVSRAARQLTVGSRIPLQPAGTHRLKGLPGEWNLFALAGDPCDLGGAGDLAPAPPDNHKLTDRVQLQLVRRAPRIARSLGRIAIRAS